MTNVNQVADDLAFVKQSVQRRDQQRTPLVIPVLWGVVALVGCTWNDFHPQTCGYFWLVAPPIAFLLSWLIGGRDALRMGEYDPQAGMRVGMHFAATFFAGAPIVLMAFHGDFNGYAMGQLLILVSGLVYFLAGVHFDPRWILPGLMMILGAVVLTFVRHYGWTVLGVGIFLSLILGFTLFPSRRSHE